MDPHRDDALDAMLYALDGPWMETLRSIHRHERFYKQLTVRMLENLYHNLLLMFWMTLVTAVLVPVFPSAKAMPLAELMFIVMFPLIGALWVRGSLQRRARECGGYWYAGRFQDPE